MIIHDVAQGSAAWFEARQGVATASNFHLIVTPKTGQYSKSSRKYAYRLLVERLINSVTETLEGQEWMERGKEMEPLAAQHYSFVNDVELLPVGFVTDDGGNFGASPDRLIKGRAAGLEIKCPAPWTHLGYLLDGPEEKYRPQVQGQIHICEFEFVDFVSYSDRMPVCTIRTVRDEPYLALLASGLAAFHEDMLRLEERARSLGLFQAYEAIETPADAAAAEQLFGGISDAQTEE